MYLSYCKNTVKKIIIILCLVTNVTHTVGKKKVFHKNKNLDVTEESLEKKSPNSPNSNSPKKFEKDFATLQKIIDRTDCCIIVTIPHKHNHDKNDEYSLLTDDVNRELKKVMNKKFSADSGLKSVEIMHVHPYSNAGKSMARYYKSDISSNALQLFCFYRGALSKIFTIDTTDDSEGLYEKIVLLYKTSCNGNQECDDEDETNNKDSDYQGSKGEGIGAESYSRSRNKRERYKKENEKNNAEHNLTQRRNHEKKEFIANHKHKEKKYSNHKCCESGCDSCMMYSRPRFGMSFGMGGVPSWQWPGYFYNRPYFYGGGFGPWATVPYWSTGFSWSV